MRDGDCKLFFIGQHLQALLPELVAHATAAPSISGDQQFMRLGIEPCAASLPPPSDTLHLKLRRLMIDTDVHKALIMHQIIDPVEDQRARGSRRR